MRYDPVLLYIKQMYDRNNTKGPAKRRVTARVTVYDVIFGELRSLGSHTT